MDLNELEQFSSLHQYSTTQIYIRIHGSPLPCYFQFTMESIYIPNTTSPKLNFEFTNLTTSVNGLHYRSKVIINNNFLYLHSSGILILRKLKFKGV